MRKAKIKYINDNMELGIDYDWDLIKRTIKRLGIYPKNKKLANDEIQETNVWNPLHVPFKSAKWFTFMSLRSKGKTTNFLLLGLVMYELYGTVTQYLVQNEVLMQPKHCKGLYNVINSCDYVRKITGNKWSAIVLKARRWYYCNYDEDGKISEMSKDYVCIMSSVDKSDQYRSTGINEPRGDLIIYDEFIHKYYMPNEFVDLAQLISTIRRMRQSPVVILLSNGVDQNSPYFNELEIADQVTHMEAGDKNIFTSSGGTNVYCEIIDPKKTEERIESDRMFFGFKNRMLGTITGSTLWAERNYPHIPRDATTKILLRQHYLKYNNKLVNLELVYNGVGMCVYCHWAKQTYDDSIIYTLEEIKSPLYRYKLGYTNLDKTIWDLYKKNKFYYGTNDVGSFIESYLNTCKMI